MMIQLTPQELDLASIVGVRRRLASLTYTERHGADQVTEADAWYYNILGAQGELAAAKALGLDWPASINAPKQEPDIPPDWQVRTRTKHTHDLIVRPDDPDDQRFILVTGTAPNLIVHGWIYGHNAKRPEWLLDRGGRNAPCYWVPQTELLPLP